MSNAEYRMYKGYSGFLVKGTTPVSMALHPDQCPHMERAFHLVAQLEASKWGSVQSYDGAGMSAGPLHNTAINPKNMTQGSLWKLMRKIELMAPACDSVHAVWRRLREANMFVSRVGDLRYYDRGHRVSAEDIRNLFTPPDGKVRAGGPEHEQAEEWALLFHRLFADGATWYAQKEHAIEWMINTRQSGEEAAYPERCDYSNAKVGDRPHEVPPFIDFAMCVYHAFSVNAPGAAGRILDIYVPDKHLKNWSDGIFARALIKGLGKSDYGRWKDNKRGNNRYDRTRAKAIKSGLWPEDYFYGPNALMPENLDV